MKRLFVVFTCVLLMACGCMPARQAAVPAPAAASGDVQARVESLLQQMTLDEKIGQMTQVEFSSMIKGDVTKYFIGSVISGGGGAPSPNTPLNWVKMMKRFQDEALATRLGIPMIYGLDAVHGFGALYGATIFPQEIGLGATRDPELVRQVAAATAQEMRAAGVPWNFGPIVAAPQDIRWGRTYESFSEDTALVSELGSAAVSGLQSLPAGEPAAEGQSLYVLATAKHYLGDGGTTFGSSTQYIQQQYLLDQGDMRMSEADVRRLFLPEYKAAVDADVQSIMVSFSSWNGEKMHGSKYWITDVLKGELGFKGFVVSDWGGIDQVGMTYDEGLVTSINAGIDMVMVPYDYFSFIKGMQAAVEKGKIPIERIDDAVRRILTVKFELGLFDQPYPEQARVEVIGSAEHRALARQAVSESLVLLKNENKALPIPKDTPLIYVAGVAADDMGVQCGGWTTQWQGESGDIQPGTTLLEGMRAAVSQNTTITYSAAGVFDGMAEYGIAVVGEFPYAEGIGDRSELTLSGADQIVIRNLREHSKKLIVVIVSGRPLVITDVYPLGDAWVAAWLPGTEGAGVSDNLFGDQPFTGKLPYTWPRFNKQLPLNLNNSAGLKGCEAPLFPYGYGLGEAGSKPIKWIECNEFED
ncbi:MAG TPA: glycoside hydrolase family 3 protein [Anaerolineaceae bacterium]|nr:glycoside hydrolase family 3 protein [Anaerolineaceae bacterium]